MASGWTFDCITSLGAVADRVDAPERGSGAADGELVALGVGELASPVGRVDEPALAVVDADVVSDPGDQVAGLRF